MSAIEAMHNGEFNTGNAIGKDDYSGVGAEYYQANSIIKEMKRNSEAWHSADMYGRFNLSERNQTLGRELQNLLPNHNIYYDDHAGKWYIDGEPLFTFDLSDLDYYHTGGKVGVPGTLKENEVLAVLEEGETVLTQKKASAMTQLVDFISDIGKKMSTSLGSIDHLTVFQKQRSLFDIGSLMAKTSSGGDITFAPEINVTVQSNGSMDDREARRVGDTIADAALDKLRDAFSKKGFNNLSAGLLKP